MAFTLIQNGRTSLQLPAATKGDAFDRLRERIRSLHGADLKLLSLDRSGHYEVKTQHREEAATDPRLLEHLGHLYAS